MTSFLEFTPWDLSAVAARGFDPYAIYRLFLGDPATHTPVRLLPGCPAATASFQAGEYNAVNAIYGAVAGRRLDLPDPWTGEPITATSSFTFSNRGNLPLEILPLVYQLTGRAGQELWAVSYSVSGRITHLLCPDEDLVICERDPALAGRILARLREAAPAWHTRSAAPQPRRVVGLLDMVTNFGHQLIHHLSGLQRLIDQGASGLPDEIWLSGTEFFGPTERLFPELAPRLRRFPDRWAIHDVLAEGDHLALRLGSNSFPRSLRTRILDLALAALDRPVRPGRRPLIAMTVRAGGRRCVNLAPAIGEAVRRLLPRHPGLGVLIDGWVLPQAEIVLGSAVATALAPWYRGLVTPEIEAAFELAAALPAGVVTECLVGGPMLASVAAASAIDAYVAHVGTLQHKLGFFADVPGVVHGPRQQLADPEGGAFQAEIGRAPAFLPATAVRDVGPPPERGSAFADYEIVDLDALHDRLAAALG